MFGNVSNTRLRRAVRLFPLPAVAVIIAPMRLAPLIGRSLFVLGVLAVGSALAWVQSDWIRRSAAVEEEGLRSSLAAGVERALSETFRELAAATAAVSPRTDAYGEWLAAAAHPGVLGPLYRVDLDGRGPTQRYEPESDSFVRDDQEPSAFAAIRSAFDAGPPARNSQESLVRKTGYYAAEDGSGSRRVLAAEVRFDLLYQEILTAALERNAPGSPADVRRRGGPPTGRSWAPDLTVELPRSLAEPRPGIPATGPIWGTLEAGSPAGPIGALVSRHRARNMVIGYGGTALVVAAALAGLVLSVRAGALRRRERDLVASVSHELRTPIAVIASLSDNLRSGVVREGRKLSEYGHMLRQEARRLSSMVEGILAFSRIESGWVGKGIADDYPLRDALAELARSLRSMCEDGGARCDIDLTRLPERARCDPEAARLVLTNLFINALRHGREQGGAAVIRASARTEPRVLVVTVEDEGPGIPRREQRRVFDPFTRGARSVSEGHPGSGLGLFIVKRTAEIGGGSVRLESPYADSSGRSYRGCRFTVRLRQG